MIGIKIDIQGEIELEEAIKITKKIGEVCSIIKKNYPSVWACIVNQYGLERNGKKISEGLFDKKLEIMFLQDNELKNK